MSDLRLAARLLARSPGFTATVAALLAAGIGANALVFAAFDAILLRPLPVRHPEQLVRLTQNIPPIGLTSYFPYKLYQALRDHSTTLAAVFAEEEFPVGLNNPQPAEQIRVRAVTPEFFDVLGVPAMLGRTLHASDAADRDGDPPAVLSYGFWQRRFHGDTGVVGRFLMLRGHKFSIAGVMPRDFNGISIDSSPDVRIPLRAMPLIAEWSGYPKTADWRDNLSMELSARLRPGVSLAQAHDECMAMFLAIRNDLPEYMRRDAERGLELERLDRGISILRDRFAGTLQLMIASVALLLLMVCSNVAGLLLARGALRREEIAVRLAMGATRARLIRQMLAESAILAGLGAIGGVVFAVIAAPLAARSIPLIRDRSTVRVAISIDLHPDLRVLLFTLAVSAITVFLFGFAPAAAASRSSLDSILRGARSIHGWRSRQVLIGFQIALCTLLLAGAGLLVRTFAQLRSVDPGFDAAHIVTFTADPSLANYSIERQRALRVALTERVRELAGVEEAAVASRALMRGSGIKTTFARAGEQAPESEFMNTSLNSVTPEYFDTMGIRMIAGRSFTAADTIATGRVIVNETFARKFFPGEDPVGKFVGPSFRGPAKADDQIIGVVADAKYRSLREPMTPTVFTLWSDAPNDTLYLVVRTRMRPESIVQPVRRILAQLDPALPFTEIETMSEEIGASTAPERLTASLASLFGAVAAVLASIGIYGLLAYVVASRRREIGIRMALGARPSDIAGLIGRQSMAITMAGVAAGLAAAIFTAPAIRALLYHVAPLDAKSFALAAILMTAISGAAAAIPASRATRVDPASSLRQD